MGTICVSVYNAVEFATYCYCLFKEWQSSQMWYRDGVFRLLQS